MILIPITWQSGREPIVFFVPVVALLPDEIVDRVMHLPERPKPSLTPYDELLTVGGTR